MQVWGCSRARDIFETPGPSSQKTTCPFSYRFRGSSGNSGVVPGNQGRKTIGLEIPERRRFEGNKKKQKLHQMLVHFLGHFCYKVAEDEIFSQNVGSRSVKRRKNINKGQGQFLDGVVTNFHPETNFKKFGPL